MTPSEHIQSLHTSYGAITGLHIRFNMDVERIWFEWWKQEYTVEDLKLVVAYLRRLYAKKPEIMVACLRLRKLIGDTLFFAEMLAEANAVARVKRMPEERADVLRATGRSTELPQQDAVRVSDTDAFREFQQFVKSFKP